MRQGIKKANYWKRKIQYISRNAAQNFLRTPKFALSANVQLTSGDCSCNCHGDCSGGDCSSCSYDNS